MAPFRDCTAGRWQHLAFEVGSSPARAGSALQRARWRGAYLAVCTLLTFSAIPVAGEPGVPGETSGSFYRWVENGDQTAAPAPWLTKEACLHLLARETLQAVGQGSHENGCPRGGVVRPQCRSDGERTVVLAELRACRVEMEGERVLHAGGELVLSVPLAQACERPRGELCGQIAVERAQVVATLTDVRGHVLRTLDVRDLPRALSLTIPCVGPTSFRANGSDTDFRQSPSAP